MTALPPAKRQTREMVQGEALFAQLRQGWKPLPTRTLLALAMGGLRVRMMRSTVTMLSIVLAIAFLTYTGLNNRLAFNLAHAVTEMENVAAQDAGAVSAAASKLTKEAATNSLPLQQQRELAITLGLADVELMATELPVQSQQLRNAELSHTKLVEDRAKTEANPKAVSAEKIEIRSRVERSESQLAKVRAKYEKADATVKLGRWIRGQLTDNDYSAQLAAALRSKYGVLIDSLAAPGRMTEADLDDAELLLALSKDEGAVRTLRETIALERRKREATEMKTMLRKAGISIEATLKGNPMDAWLITMAMLTCAVGIANAMLMSVTERFREIGTMKCLGAVDSLVVKLFLLESGVLGVVGALIGIVLGIAVALMGAVLQFGGAGVSEFPRMDAAWVVLGSVLGGVVLAVVGAVYPAFAASRMRPVDALRVDE